MANNTKLALISVSLAQKLNDAFDKTTGAAIAGDGDGNVLSAVQRMAYINRAMHKLVGNVWDMANQKDYKNAKQIFAGIFPELVVARTVTTTSASLYVIATPNLDYFQLLEATVDSMQAELMPSHLYLTVKSGRTIQIKGSATIPMVVEIGGSIYFLPDNAAFQSKSAVLTFLRTPLNNGTTGTAGIFLTMNNSTSEDSPFLNSWNDKIVEIAEQLFRADAKE